MTLTDKPETPEELARECFDFIFASDVQGTPRAAALIVEVFERWSDEHEARLVEIGDRGGRAARRIATWRDLLLDAYDAVVHQWRVVDEDRYRLSDELEAQKEISRGYEASWIKENEANCVLYDELEQARKRIKGLNGIIDGCVSALRIAKMPETATLVATERAALDKEARE